MVRAYKLGRVAPAAILSPALAAAQCGGVHGTLTVT
jgi:hypothetical protein